MQEKWTQNVKINAEQQTKHKIPYGEYVTFIGRDLVTAIAAIFTASERWGHNSELHRGVCSTFSRFMCHVTIPSISKNRQVGESSWKHDPS
jgi:hypothetical protein